ncbi:rCG48501 [Rattus norvegicus]|uniref:RCG48501 n=1 Tax=Rattus norvegicus TaxID=10116 RepID=A6HZR7_RAT|nr:rCG48501 [Rattus norvegicus]
MTTGSSQELRTRILESSCLSYFFSLTSQIESIRKSIISPWHIFRVWPLWSLPVSP